jgi:hypothetical protein
LSYEKSISNEKGRRKNGAKRTEKLREEEREEKN